MRIVFACLSKARDENVARQGWRAGETNAELNCSAATCVTQAVKCSPLVPRPHTSAIRKSICVLDFFSPVFFFIPSPTNQTVGRTWLDTEGAERRESGS